MRDEPLPQGQRLADLATRQHGVVSIRQLRRLGYSSSGVSRAVRNGTLHPIHRGVYAVGHIDIPLYGRCIAAVMAGGPDALLSHYSAAWMWGLSKSHPAPFHVTAPSPRHARPPLVLHHARNLTPEDRARRERVPLTAVPRTLLDQAAVVPQRRLRRLIERTEELRLFDLVAVERLLTRTVGHPGHGPLRGAITLYRRPRFSRSELEREFLAAVERAGLPGPLSDWVELGYELDVYWLEHRFAVELDVFETHGTREAFERDRLRQEDLKLAGIELIRVTGPRFEREPEQVICRVARLLAQRRTGER
jgi:putative AbiEi antitoxin of type IV toxin-antitoxin system